LSSLAPLVHPSHTALVTVEVQQNVVGAGSVIPDLATAAAATGMIDHIAALARAARARSIPVVHCTAERRPDGLGANNNARLFALARRGGGRPPREGADRVHDGVGAEPSDIVLPRLHGLSPMTGTSLDPVLRNLGVTTIVATGVSVNVALLGLVFEAVNHGYTVVVPRDATVGFPAEYVDAVFEHSLAYIATITTTDVVRTAWAAGV
jgi:nicotinamidase-related amidase